MSGAAASPEAVDDAAIRARWRPLVGVGGLVFAVVWAWAAVAKLLDPLAAVEFAARLVGPGTSAELVVAGTVGLEILLATSIVARLWNGLRASLGLVLVLIGVLLVVRSRSGGALPCGCFGGETTVNVELIINGAMAVALIALVALETWSARSPQD